MTFSNCSDAIVPVYWLGRVGDLQSVRTANEGYSRLPDPHELVHDLLDGQVVDRSLREQRTWTLDLDSMLSTDWVKFEEIRTGARGLGPYVWIDPATTNCFTPNIASGTDVLLSSEGFVVTGVGQTVTSQTNVFQRGSRALAWTLSPAPTGAATALAMTTSYAASGWATPPGQAWSMTGYLNSNGDYTPLFDGLETGVLANWLVINGSIAQSGAQFHSGANSGLITVSGSPATETFAYRTDFAAPGKTYTIGIWTRAGSLYNNVAAEIAFADNASGSLGAFRSPLVMTSGVVTDTFTRATANGWGTSDTGHAWTVSGGVVGDYSTSANTGRMSLSSVNVARTTTLTVGGNDQVVAVDITAPVTSAATAPIRWRVAGRVTDANNYYYAMLELGTDGVMRLSLNKRVASVETALVSNATVATNTSGNVYHVTLSAIGSTITATAQNSTTASATLTQTATDVALTTGELTTLYAILATGNTNTTPLTFVFDNFTVTSTPSPVGVWEYRTLTVTSPANTAFVYFGVANTLAPPNGETLYLDDVTFSASTAITTVTPQLAWIDVNGTTLSVSSGASLTAAAASGWQSFSVSGTAPNNAVYVLPIMKLDPIVAVASPTVYLDTLMLDMRATARSWVVGQGQPRVAISSNREVIPRIGRPSMSYRLYEVSA